MVTIGLDGWGPVRVVDESLDWVLSELRLPSGEAHPLDRVVDVELLGEDRVVIAEGSTNSLFIGSPNGSTWTVAGRTGDGPGEFRALTFVQVLAPDRILAFDGSSLSVSAFDGEGGLVGETRLPDLSRGGAVPIWAANGDDQYLFLNSGFTGSSQVGAHRGRGPLVRIDGEAHDTLALFPGIETFVVEGGMGSVMFGALTHMAGSAAGGVGIADTDRPEVQLWSGPGTPDVVVRWTPPEARDIEALRDSMVTLLLERAAESVSDEEVAGMREILDRRPVAADLPHLGGLVAAVDGGLGIAPFVPFELSVAGREPAAGLWTVVDASGAPKYQVRMPGGLVPYVLSDDLVVGVYRDGLGVESVRRYRIRDGS